MRHCRINSHPVNKLLSITTSGEGGHGLLLPAPAISIRNCPPGGNWGQQGRQFLPPQLKQRTIVDSSISFAKNWKAQKFTHLQLFDIYRVGLVGVDGIEPHAEGLRVFFHRLLLLLLSTNLKLVMLAFSNWICKTLLLFPVSWRLGFIVSVSVRTKALLKQVR